MAAGRLDRHRDARAGDRETPRPADRDRESGGCGRYARAREHGGERAFFYHTGDEKQIVGIVEIAREAYKDPTDEKGVFYCVDTRAVEPFKTPVTLATVKADAKLKNMVLAREPRLSVQAVTDEEWKQICKMGGVRG